VFLKEIRMETFDGLQIINNGCIQDKNKFTSINLGLAIPFEGKNTFTSLARHACVWLSIYCICIYIYIYLCIYLCI